MHSAYPNPRPDKKFVQLLYSTVLSEMSRGLFAVMYMKKNKLHCISFPLRRYNDDVVLVQIGVWV